MASKNVGLIGQGRGPTVFVGGRAETEICGLTCGEIEVIALDREGVPFESVTLYEDGRTEFVECHSLVFNNPGRCKTVVCSVITGG